MNDETARRLAAEFLTAIRARHAQFMADKGPDVPDCDVYLRFAELTEEGLLRNPLTPEALAEVKKYTQDLMYDFNAESLMDYVSATPPYASVNFKRAIPYALYAALGQAAAAKKIAEEEFARFTLENEDLSNEVEEDR